MNGTKPYGLHDLPMDDRDYMNMGVSVSHEPDLTLNLPQTLTLTLSQTLTLTLTLPLTSVYSVPFRDGHSIDGVTIAGVPLDIVYYLDTHRLSVLTLKAYKPTTRDRTGRQQRVYSIQESKRRRVEGSKG